MITLDTALGHARHPVTRNVGFFYNMTDAIGQDSDFLLKI